MKTKHEVVISGLAGMFPESANLSELKENLMKKINLVTNDERKWNKENMDVPIHTGKMPGVEKFDGFFFGIPDKLSDTFEFGIKKCLEASYSAIVDAGLNPGEISGTNTAVLSCCCLSDAEYEGNLHYGVKSGSLITGTSKAMQSNRIAFHLNARGPSYTIDNSWNGCFEAIQYAYDKISNGYLKAVIVTSCSFIFIPESSYHFHRMGRLNNDGCTKCFSDDADGYSRSEGCVAFFLQRKEDALRSYGTVLGVSASNQEGKNSSFADVAPGQYLPILKHLYEENNIDPLSVAYVEGAGCASKVVDAEELNSVAQVLLPGRKEPLPIGCVKSNLGHCESTADGVSLMKALLVADSGLIYPNIHYTSPNSLVPALVSGKLKVVTEPTPLTGNVIGVNSISIIGSLKHVVIKQHDKVKKTEVGKGKLPPDGVPRLFIMSGRNKEDTEKSLKKVETMPVDSEFIALTHRVFKNGIKNHMLRGYTVINDVQQEHREISEFFTGQKPEQLWFVFTGMGSQWLGMGTQLMKLPKFAESVQKCHDLIKHHGISVFEILTTNDPKLFDNVVNSFIGIAVIQIGLVDVLYDMGIVPDGIIGHSVGELGCAYADGCLTAEQVLLCALSRGMASVETDLIKGMMAAVGKGHAEIKDSLPESIDIACHNSPNNCTLSGPEEQMRGYVEHLTKQNVFARLVNAGNIAYHSRYIKPAGPALLQYLKKFISQPKLRSKKWISTSVPEKDWDSDLAKYCSAEYQTNNLLSPVLFEEAAVHVPQNATIIEIAPHGLLQPILKQCFPNAYHIPLTKRGHPQGLIFLCKALGKIYLRGHSLDLEKLYPPVEYPVSRGTETLSDLLNWETSHIFKSTLFLLKDYAKVIQEVTAIHDITIDLEEGFNDLKHYELDGVPVIPLGPYLELGINELKKQKGNDFHLVQFKNIKLLKHMDINGKCDLYSQFQACSGNWELWKDDGKLVQMQMNSLRDYTFQKVKTVKGSNEPVTKFYERLDRFGLKIGPAFRLIKAISASLPEEISATVLWDGKLSNFLEAVLQVPLAAYKDANRLLFVNKASSITIDLDMFSVNERKEVNVYFNTVSKVLYCDGLEIANITTAPVFKKLNKDLIFQEPQFLHYDSSSVQDSSSFFTLVQEIVKNNFTTGNIASIDLSILEIGEDLNFHNELYDAFQNVPGLNVYFKIIPHEKYLADQFREKNILIASASLSSTLSILEHFSEGFVLVREKLLPTGVEIITSKKIGNHVYALCKKAGNQKKNLFVPLYSNGWETKLKNHLNTCKDQKVCLIGNVTKISKMYYIIQKTSNLNNAQNIRYLFHDSSIESNESMFFETQLAKGLRINILQENKWGFISFKTVPLKFKPVQQLTQRSIFNFSQILIEGIDVKAIGLNPTDLSGIHNKIGIVEYSGSMEEENLCGIGIIDELSNTINPDGILKWKKPQNWSHDEITSVLLPYSMAYYIIKLTETRRKFEVIKSRTILVHRGSLPFSQALIYIAESEGFDVYTSYKDEIEKQLIKKLFPQIPSANIVSCETCFFYDTLLAKTNGEGIHIIVSCLPEKEMIKANTLLMAERGFFYQTGFEKDFDNSHLGMGFFFKSTSADGLTPSSFMALSNDEKKLIRDHLKDGLKSGQIKPLPMTAIKDNIDNNTAEELFKDPSFTSHRLVLSPNGKFVKNTSSLSISDENAHYLISVPTEGEGLLWIYILEWLLCKRALNVHIIIDWNGQPEFIHERFDVIKRKYPRCAINVESSKVLDKPEKIKQFIGGIKQKGNLASVFVSSEEYSEKLKAICEASCNSRIMYFTKQLDETFEESSKDGLLILDQTSLIDADMFNSLIEPLVQLNTNILVLTPSSLLSSSTVVDDPWKKYNQHLPWTFNEIITCSENSKNICWKEVRTSTFRFQDCKGLPPVLIIPPIRKGQLDKLVKSLFYPAFQAVIPRNTHSVPELAKELCKEVRTSTFRFQDCKGLPPVLIIPPIRKGQLDKLVKSLFYPAFQAVIPRNTHSVPELAKELCKKAVALKTDGFTLLCSDWSFPIGIQLGKLLESVGKRISIVFFQPLLNLDSAKLYQAVHQKITEEEVKHHEFCEDKTKLLQASFDFLKRRLELIDSGTVANEKGNKLQGFVVLVKNKLSSDNMSSELSELCENPIVVHNSEEKSFLDMMNSKETAAVVNTTALVHYADAATNFPKTYSLERYFDNPRHEFYLTLVNDSKYAAD